MDQADLVAQLDGLLEDHNQLLHRAEYSDLSDLPPAQTEALAVRAHAAIRRIAPLGSAYRLEVEAIREPGVFRIPSLIGILNALRADIEAGYLKTVEELIHADTFSDLLAMSDELQVKGYIGPAAVLAGSVLESHLRLLCVRAGLPITTKSGSPAKADGMNAELARSGEYNALQQKHVTAWLGVRNSAAHGRNEEYDADQVRALVAGVGDFILKHPA